MEALDTLTRAVGARGHLHQNRAMCLMAIVGVCLVADTSAAIAASSEGVATPVSGVRFSYARGDGVVDCPEADAIRGGVAARMGYDPFDDAGRALIAATITKRGGILEAKVEMFGAAGEARTERVLTSRRNDCVELAAAVEFAITIAIDPARSARTHPEPPIAVPTPLPPPPPVIVIEQPSRPRPLPAPPAGPDRRSPAPAPVATILQARLGVVGAMGSAPSVAVGGTIALSARRRFLSLAVEGRADLPASTALRTGEVATSLLTVSLVPCVHRGVLGGCVVVSAGAIRASGHGLIDSRQVTMPFVAIGGRVGLEFPLVGVLTGLAFLDASAPLTETVLLVGGESVWTSAPIVVMVGLSVGARFP